ncbi:MAG: hypothetical protein ACM335_12540 [Deltaproteobacteria bacterium]
MSKKIILGVIAILFQSVSVFSGGTVFDEEIDTILDQQPEIARFVRSTLDFCKASWFAEIRLAGNYPLGGMRLGPYTRRCRATGSKGNFDFVLTLNTSYKGFDAHGRQVDVIEAVKIDEELVSIDLRYDACKEDWCKARQQSAPPDRR